MSLPTLSPVSTWRDEALGWLGRPTRGRIAAAVLFTVALYVWRSGDGVTRPQLWAEDGVEFFSAAEMHGIASITMPYAGYLQVAHRVVAFIASLFTATVAPDLYIAFTVLIVAWTATVVATAEDRHAWLLASVMMLVPVGDEVWGVLTNEQWFAQVGLFVVAVTPSPASRAARLSQIAFVLLFSLDGPFAIFLAPLGAWRLWTDGRDGHARAIGLIVVSVAALQVSLAVRYGNPYTDMGQHRPWHLASAMLDHWIGESAHRGPTARPPSVRADVLFAASLAAAAFTCGPLARKALLYATLLLAATFTRFLTYTDYLDNPGSGERYFYFPRLALLWCFLSCAVRLRPPSVFGVIGLAMMAFSFDHWVRAPLAVVPWREKALEFDRGGAMDAVISPSNPDDPGPDAWTIRVPARR